MRLGSSAGGADRRTGKVLGASWKGIIRRVIRPSSIKAIIDTFVLLAFRGEHPSLQFERCSRGRASDKPNGDRKTWSHHTD